MKIVEHEGFAREAGELGGGVEDARPLLAVGKDCFGSGSGIDWIGKVLHVSGAEACAAPIEGDMNGCLSEISGGIFRGGEGGVGGKLDEEFLHEILGGVRVEREASQERVQ